LCTYVYKNLDFLSIHPEMHNQYIAHDILESESEIWALHTSVIFVLIYFFSFSSSFPVIFRFSFVLVLPIILVLVSF